MLVVISIIGVLAAAVVSQYYKYSCTSIGARAETAIRAVRSAYGQCIVDYGEGSCEGGLNQTIYNRYLSSLPVNHLSYNTSGGQLNRISYEPVGCAYNAPGGGTASNCIYWTVNNADISNC